MLERFVGVFVFLGLVLAVGGEIANSDPIMSAGLLLLLVTATAAGIKYLRFHLTTPVFELSGVVTEYKSLPTYCILSLRTGLSDVYYGQASRKTGAGIKVGDRIQVKVKGKYILEAKKINTTDKGKSY
ncbi:MAG: hypothetical protein GX949_00575 [Peptococcaceae bacterium]|nr:hypothetical protein [Peptococcaceae bacterium]